MSGQPDRQQLEALFVQHLPVIDRIVASLCRRHGVAGDDADDFGSWARMRLVEDDYGILRKFRGESALATYLVVVLGMLFREYRVARWGRWRPSAAARRLGSVAVRLETLVYRDGCTRAQAIEIVRTAGEAAMDDAELRRLFAQLPARTRSRPVPAGEAALDALPADCAADDGVAHHEAVQLRARLEEALEREIERLPPDDRRVLRLRFWHGLSVADTARALAIEQKPLYRRIERALAELRKGLEAAGISREELRELLMDQEAA
ncbi:MAG TPA: sigma-70 family RNA polymerase sigma factor [Longimicrobiaceae bacterium]|nr:sigma-70 family RNA polymerase sigma factor [Longimicrobiaceae bacterium]